MEKKPGQGLNDRITVLIRRFGFSFAGGMAILTAVGIWKHFPIPLVVGIVLLCSYHLVFALVAPRFLYPTYCFMRGLGRILGNIITAIVFTVFFYLLFTPIALLVRFFKKDVIAYHLNKPVWIPVPENKNDPSRVERMF